MDWPFWVWLILYIVIAAFCWMFGYIVAALRPENHCPHEHVTGIYGDAISAHGGYRLICNRCGRTLDGPVSIADRRP